MAGCLDSVTVTIPKMPRMDSLVEFIGERRNKVTAIAAGVLVSMKESFSFVQSERDLTFLICNFFLPTVFLRLVVRHRRSGRLPEQGGAQRRLSHLRSLCDHLHVHDQLRVERTGNYNRE